MSRTPKTLDECVHTADFDAYKTEHAAEHRGLADKVENNEHKLLGVEVTLKNLVNINRLILGAIVSGLVSVIVILLTRGL